MKLSEIKEILRDQKQISFKLPDETLVPEHFHVTEIGLIQKRFIDCGGTFRTEEKISFQLWNADDYNHRLHPDKLLHIIELSENKLALEDQEIEVEYQGLTIQKFGLTHQNGQFLLTSLKTDCLAKDACGIPENKPRVRLSQITSNSCSPGSGCC